SSYRKGISQMSSKIVRRCFSVIVFVAASLVFVPQARSLIKVSAAQANQSFAGFHSSFTPPYLPTIDQDTVKLIKQGFGQNDREVGFGFIVENSNPSQAIEDSQYQIVAYSADGTVVQTGSGYIDLLFPSQKLGVAGALFVEEGVVVSKIEVQLSSG